MSKRTDDAQALRDRAVVTRYLRIWEEHPELTEHEAHRVAVGQLRHEAEERAKARGQ